MDFDLCIGHECGNITTTAGKHFVLHLGKHSQENELFSYLLDHCLTVPFFLHLLNMNTTGLDFDF